MNRKIYPALLIIVALLFCFSTFKHISYPLLWNDEAECVMHGKRVIEYGFPKVSDGKNVVNPMRHDNKKLAVNEDIDAYVGLGWSMFYYSAIGILWADGTHDIYKKTARLRIPFAAIGMAGLIILAMAFMPLFERKEEKYQFLIIYALFCTLSVSLVLHLREVRYYSLTIFLSSCIIYLFTKYSFYKKMGYSKFMAGMVILLIMLFNTFVPPFFIFIAYLMLYETYNLFLRLSLKYNNDNGIDFTNSGALIKKTGFEYIRSLIPYIVTGILVIPLLSFYKTFFISGETNKFYHFTMYDSFEHLVSILSYFAKYEFLFTALLIKFLSAIAFKLSDKNNIRQLKKVIRVSSFLSLFFAFYILLLIAFYPTYIFTRYIIFLVPLLYIIMALDLHCVLIMVKKDIRKIVIISCCLVFTFDCIAKIPEIKGHVHEMFHKFQGPLDFIIPYIHKNYQNTENLVIATNYEECAYMYYLGSKVTFGFNLANQEEDKMVVPDIINYRKMWNWVYKFDLFLPFLNKEKYHAITFPVLDYPTNNIPDLNMENRHLYKTAYATGENDKVLLYMKTPVTK